MVIGKLGGCSGHLQHTDTQTHTPSSIPNTPLPPSPATYPVFPALCSAPTRAGNNKNAEICRHSDQHIRVSPSVPRQSRGIINFIICYNIVQMCNTNVILIIRLNPPFFHLYWMNFFSVRIVGEHNHCLQDLLNH